MDIIEVSGSDLQDLVTNLSRRGVTSLHVSVHDGGAKFKINAGIWSPPLGKREGTA